MRFFLPIFIPFVGMLIGLPLLGAWVVGLPLGPYLEFPPQTRFIRHAGFSWPAFVCMSALIVAMILPVLLQALRSYRLSPRPAARGSHPFPWWGWIALAAGAAAWALAWTRFPWMAAFQAHTFTPLWLAYIVGVNALCVRRTGRSLLDMSATATVHVPSPFFSTCETFASVKHSAPWRTASGK